jgi:hypothetical protein
MADGRALVSFLNDTDIILTLLFIFFFQGENRMASFNLPSDFFFLQYSMATSAFFR